MYLNSPPPLAYSRCISAMCDASLVESLARSHAERARSLGISESALADAPTPTVAPRREPGTCVRVLQWNVLADGMGDDGFLLADVLGEAPPGGEAGFRAALAAVQEATKAKADMQPLKEQFSTPFAIKNHAAVVDWPRRWARMQELIASAMPDVITMQELDHMGEAQEDLGRLGYECAMPGAKYTAAHRAGLDVGATDKYMAFLRDTRVAYAPNVPSTCRKLGLKTNPSADDDGSAIFWRASTMQADSIDFLPFKDPTKRHNAVVRVKLRRQSDGARLFVLCAHLSSGDKPADEALRLQEIQASPSAGPSVLAWLSQSIAEAPTVFCLDANSAPGRTDEQTVWKALHGVRGVSSVWDEYFSATGEAKLSPAPVTTNKMRGPLSGQPKKIGEHFCHVIDHIFLSSALSLTQHALAPLSYPSMAEAQGKLLPSVGMPSDHAPVIVDLSLPVQGQKSAIGWCLEGMCLPKIARAWWGRRGN
mmetsp:Transcript_92329/g.275435  ORF Transcript_92329/g.275435 Transcript_92329/m.275435 type:complete len:479 (+) Transcript_92329:2-1438(+)